MREPVPTEGDIQEAPREVEAPRPTDPEWLAKQEEIRQHRVTTRHNWYRVYAASAAALATGDPGTALGNNIFQAAYLEK